MNIIISIEGNIGSGKSTILKQLKNYTDNIVYIDEPVDEWESIKDSNNNSILELFYANQEKHAFNFQILAYITRLRLIINAIKINKNKIIICERSIFTDKYVFAKMLFDQNKISDIEWKTYNYWFSTFEEITRLNGIIYVDTNPETCFKRIKKRNRNGESNIPINYLKECDLKHHEWIDNTKVKKLIINGNEEFEYNYDHKKIINESCVNFCNQLFSSRTEASITSS